MKRLIFLLTTLTASGADIPADRLAFFESSIRPVLASACYDCHGAERQKSGLRLDWSGGLLKGGQRGPAIVPGDPEKSLLIQAIAHTHAELKMPKTGDALSAATVEAFREWIRTGAHDPRDKLPDGTTPHASDWPAVFALRKQWWCFQPLKEQEAPKVEGTAHPVDCFLRAAMQKAGLSPSPAADPATRVRRAAFILTGLPPEEKEVTAFTNDPSPAAWSALVDRLLASPQFGERWARHWMDWLRYAESHGSEGDPAIRYAWRYRDYLIRALNANVPWPQLVREHIAGDRLSKPRVNEALGLNESAIGPAHLRMVFHGFTPTDALDEFVTFTDNQVDVVSKAFMGLTVSCARCHNHKFDAISQEDYYALYGIFASCRPAVINADAPASVDKKLVFRRMSELKNRLCLTLGDRWKNDAGFAERLKAWKPANEALHKEADGEGTGPLAAWLRLKDLPPQQMTKGWKDLSQKWEALHKKRKDFSSQPSRVDWQTVGNLAIYTSGHGLEPVPQDSVSCMIATAKDRLVGRVRPEGLYSDAISDRQGGVIQTSRFKCEGGRLWVRAAGNNAVLRYVVQNYPRSGLIYPKNELRQEFPGWLSWNLDYWKGEVIHLELTTIPEAPIESNDADRAWFTLNEVIYPKDAAAQPPPPGTSVAAHYSSEEAPSTKDELVEIYRKAVHHALLCWSSGSHTMAADDAEFLDFMVRSGILPNDPAYCPEAAALKEEYQKLEATLQAPVRVPGLMEADAFNQPMYVRGDHKKPESPVPRRFLEAFDGKPYKTKESGRLQLAENLVSDANPLPSRIIVNRLWHHVFGRGIVATTDNFGKLGDLPTHPELLDWLALRFQKNGGSIKETLKLLLTSEAFQASAQAQAPAAEKDPENKLLSHFSLRRLEAEAIRDAILSVSGKLDLTPFGPSVDGGTPRRSVYVRVIRNALDPFLSAFDAPVPSSTRGRRDSTNVPAQALALMNSPMIQSWARDWADRVCRSTVAETERVRQFYRTGFSREPGDDDVAQCLAHVHEAAAQGEAAAAQAAEWRKRLAAAESERDSLLLPVRQRLAEERQAVRPPPGSAPEPVADWDFEKDAGDRKGALHLELHGSARLEGGALWVDGKNSYASTPVLTKTLRAKTLEAWVQLATLEQSGGGVLSVQTPDGIVFDAIVFAEQQIGQWRAGSDNAQRTESTNGSQDREAASRPVHVAITYDEDGSITVWRDGKRYGRSYKSTGPVTYEASRSRVLLGLRHGEPGGNRMLNGRILRARLYDRALTEKEIAVSSQLEGAAVSPEDVLAALTPGDRRRYEATVRVAEEAGKHAVEFAATSSSPKDAAWQSLALAMINMKEFIYLR